MNSWFQTSNPCPSTYDTLEAALDNLEYCQILRISSFQNIPAKELAGIEKLFNLEELKIGMQNLDPFPFDISQLKKLTELTLDECQLTAIPPKLEKLKKLHTLSISNPKNFSLSSGIPKLKRLEVLNLQNCAVDHFPETIFNLKNLAALSVSSSNLKMIPDNLSDLRNLKSLNLCNNRMELFPLCLCQLSQLSGLDLSGNLLKTIPEEISQLTQLRYLSLDGNSFDSLPQVLREMSKTVRITIEPKYQVLYDDTVSLEPKKKPSKSIDRAAVPQFIKKDYQLSSTPSSQPEELTATSTTDGHTIEIYINNESPDTGIEPMSVADDMLIKIEEHWPEIQSNLVNSFLDLYNEDWSDPEGDLPIDITANQFLNLIYLSSISIMDHAMELVFGDNELFCGHHLCIFWDLKEEKIYDGSLEG